MIDIEMFITKSRYPFLRDLIEGRLADLKDFLTLTENFIEKEEKKELERWDKNPDPDFYPFEWQDIIGDILRKSFIVTLISSAEMYIRMISMEIAQLTKKKFYKDKRLDFFTAAKNFLESSGFSKPSQTQWEVMICIYKLRNCIIHNASIVDPAKPKITALIETLIQKNIGLSLEDHILRLDKNFCFNALEHVKNFFASLIDEYIVICGYRRTT